jgi:hypothetical protein
MTPARVKTHVLKQNRGAVFLVELTGSTITDPSCGKGKKPTHKEVAATAHRAHIMPTTGYETHLSGSVHSYSLDASAVGTTFTESHYHHPAGQNLSPVFLAPVDALRLENVTDYTPDAICLRAAAIGCSWSTTRSLRK